MLKYPNGPVTMAAVLYSSMGMIAATTPSPARFPLSPDAVIERYSAARRDQATRLYGSSAEVYITAKLPKLDKQGRLHALRHISDIGSVTYEALEFEGIRPSRAM